MRFFILFAFFSQSFIVSAQHYENPLDKIREQFKIINSAMDYQILNLDDDTSGQFDDLLEMGINYTAFLKSDTLYKIIEYGFTASQKTTIEYYFWDDSLFFVFQKVQLADYDSLSSSFNFDHLATQAETRLYLKGEKLIKRSDKGDSDFYFLPEKTIGKPMSFPNRITQYFKTKSKL